MTNADEPPGKGPSCLATRATAASESGARGEWLNACDAQKGLAPRGALASRGGGCCVAVSASVTSSIVTRFVLFAGDDGLSGGDDEVASASWAAARLSRSSAAEATTTTESANHHGSMCPGVDVPRTMRGACADPSGDSASATSAATEASASSHPSIEICASFVRQSTTATTGGRSHARRSEDSRPVRISACGHFGRTTRARSRCRRRSSVRLAAGEGGWGGVGVVVSSRERCYRDATCSRARGRGVRMDAVGSYRGCRRRRRRARAPMG